MISILIPTYNYNVFPLVAQLHSWFYATGSPFEIRVCDDASPERVSENEKISELAHVTFTTSKINLGRTGIRHQLAADATYDYLLFMDADVLPKHEDFAVAFLREIGHDIVFGGICYKTQPPAREMRLRWTYGRSRETVSVAERKKQPYLTVNSGCFMIKRNLFLRLNEKLQLKKYGLDNYFKELLRNEKVSVSHIDNPVYHLGLEENEKFLKKSLEAIETTHYLEKEGLLPANARPLQKSFQKLKRWRLTGLFTGLISLFKKGMERNFLGNRPNLFYFDLYRLHYYIQLKRKSDA
ncbi:MAG: glycosyltransferase family 2 protein [Bacteroidota bacterium]